MGQKGKTSVASFYDAESGVEWALHTITTSNGDIKTVFNTANGNAPAADGSISCPTGVGGAGCKVYLLKADGAAMTQAEINATTAAPTFADVQAVRAVGREGNDTQRAIEAAVAATGGAGSYEAYGTTTCAPGWTVAYTGVAMTALQYFTLNTVVGGVGGPVCKAGGTLPLSGDGPGALWVTETSHSTRLTISCAVCVK